MLRTVYLTIFGLNTPADSECYGLRAVMQGLAGAGDAAYFFAFDDPQLAALLERAAAGFGRIVMCGHSHGGAAVKWILDRWAAGGGPMVDVAIFLDPAPEVPHFGQFFLWQAADGDLRNRWHVPLSVCWRAACVYQRNEMIVPGLIGVCGVPFVPVPVAADSVCVAGEAAPAFVGVVQNYNVTAWGVYHCHMLAEGRVQALIREFARTA